MGERLVVLAVMLATFTGSHATEFSRNGPTGADDAMSAPLGTTDTGTKRMFGQRADDLHLVDPSRDELRQYLESIPLPTHAQNCEEWLPTDARAGFLLPVAGSARLFVGQYLRVAPTVGEVRVPNVQRHYAVASFSRFGAPFDGAITIRLSSDFATQERTCIERLVGMRVLWPSLAEDPTDVGETVTMVVQEVRFREAAEVGSAGALVPTGDTVAMLALSERWMSMARREMRAHVWGIFGGMVGSVVLMVLITVGKRAAGWYRKLATCHRLVRKALSQPPESRVSAVGLDNEPPDAPPTPTDSAPPSLDRA